MFFWQSSICFRRYWDLKLSCLRVKHAGWHKGLKGPFWVFWLAGVHHCRLLYQNGSLFPLVLLMNMSSLEGNKKLKKNTRSRTILEVIRKVLTGKMMVISLLSYSLIQFLPSVPQNLENYFLYFT